MSGINTPEPFDLPNTVAALAIIGFSTPITFIQQASLPTNPTTLAFWLDTSLPNKLYANMRNTGGNWRWVPLAAAS